MNKFFVAIAAFAFGLTGAAMADEATLLTDTQMDQIVAGAPGEDQLILPDGSEGPLVGDGTWRNDERTETGYAASGNSSAQIDDEDD